MVKVMSYDEAISKQTKELGIAIKAMCDDAEERGFQRGLKRTAKLYPVQDSGNQSIVVRDATDTLIADLYGVIEKQHVLSNGKHSFHIGTMGTVIVHTSEVEDVTE